MPTPSSRLIPYLKVTFAVTVWGGSFIATKIALLEVSPMTVVWLRFAMGVAILAGAVLLRRQFALPKGTDWLYFALLGFIGITFHTWLQATGLQTAQATTTAWIVATTPVYIALLGWLILKERLGLYQVAGILLAAVGVLLVVSGGDRSALFGGSFLTFGDVLILISAPNWAVFSVLSRRGLQTYPAARMMLYVMAIGWILTSILLFTAGPGLGDVSRLSLNGWLGVSFLGIFCSGLGYIFWYDGLQAIPASQVGAFLYLEPLVTMVVAGIILNEPVLWASILGGATILLGVWLVQRPQKTAVSRIGEEISREAG